MKKEAEKLCEHTGDDLGIDEDGLFFCTKCDPSRLVEDIVDYIVWDLETTGFVAPNDKILEIGLCIVYTNKKEVCKNWILNNNIDIPEKITELTTIDQKLIDEEGRDPAECLREFLPYFKVTNKNVTHNGIKFDIPFLVEYAADIFKWNDMQKMATYNLLWKSAFDTAVGYKAFGLGLTPEFRESFVQFANRVMNIRSTFKFNLGVTADYYKIDRSQITQHRALGDVYLTNEIYKLISK